MILSCSQSLLHAIYNVSKITDAYPLVNLKIPRAKRRWSASRTHRNAYS